jgi:hypothetical protein
MDLTSVGIEAAARHLHHLASGGEPWAQASQQLRTDFRGHVEAVINAAHEAQMEDLFEAPPERCTPGGGGAAHMRNATVDRALADSPPDSERGSGGR